MTTSEARAVRESKPISPRDLFNWVYAYTGVKIARRAVCRCHQSPWEGFKNIHLGRPPMALVLGPRGGGKSFLSGLDTHLTSRFHPGHGTRILGGSKAQSEQVYRAIHELALDGKGPLGNDRDAIIGLHKTEAKYRNGSEVSILAASPTSVRGPHVPTLKLDEVDEIDPDIRESSMGMCMAKKGSPASVVMTSTWHRVGGPMAGLIERGRSGEFPVYSFCAFEVLERCPVERSGPNLELCPECPLVKWCHEDRKADPSLPPKAKMSAGHYTIDALIQKVRTVSVRTFEADYLCKGPKADGVWFKGFHRDTHVTDDAEFDPRLPVHLSIDSGVFTGAVWFQVKEVGPQLHKVNVFADLLSEGKTAQENAYAISSLCDSLCNGRREVLSTDPAGGSRTAIGPTVIGEYVRAGLCDQRHLKEWPRGSVADSLSLLESFVEPAGGGTLLTIHSRCEKLIQSFEGYSRAKLRGQWQDYPTDPQHPYEDMIDAMRGGLKVAFPEGRTPPPNYSRIPARKLF